MNDYGKIFSKTGCPGKEIFYKYRDGKLTNNEQHAFEKHLLDCVHCHEVYEGIASYPHIAAFEEDLRLIHCKVLFKRSYSQYFYIAASLALLFVFSYIGWRSMEEKTEILKEKAVVVRNNDVAIPVLEDTAMAGSSPETTKEEKARFHAFNHEGTEKDERALPLVQKELPTQDSHISTMAEQENSIALLEPEKSHSPPSQAPHLVQKNEPKEIQLDVQMHEDTSALEEVVVQGYGTDQRKEKESIVSSIRKRSEKKSTNVEISVNDLVLNKKDTIGTAPSSFNRDSLLAIIDLQLTSRPEDEKLLWEKSELLKSADRKTERRAVLEIIVKTGKKYKGRAKKELEAMK